jgi:hypothetical protein
MAEKTLQDLIAGGQTIPDEELMRLYQAQRARDVGGLRAVGQGAFSNFADELEARARTLGTNQDYRNARDKIRKEYQQYSEEYPGESTMLELAGGALPMAFTGGAGAAPKAAGMLSKIAASPTARAMATGTVQGGVSGAGAAQEMSDIPAEAANMAVMGAGLGSVLPSVGRGASGILSTIKDYISPNVQKKTAQLLSKAAQDANMTPQQLMAKIVEDRQAGVTSSNLASTSDELQALAERVSERSPASARTMRQDAANTLDYQPGRVMRRVKDDLRAGDYRADLDQTVRNLRADAPQWYEEAYAFGDVQHPDIAKILNHKDFADAFRTAKGIAETEALAAELRGEDPSKYKLKELYQTVTNDKGELTGFKLVDVPDVRTLDYLKRGIQANIDSAYKGQGMSTAKASALKDVLDPFLATVDRVTVDPATGVSRYAQTRKMYGDEKEIINAFEAGRNDFAGMDHEDVSAWYDGLSNTAKQAARTGVARGIFNKMDKATQGEGSVAKVVGGSYNSDKLRPLFESDDKFDLFQAAMKREMELHDQAKDFLSASSRGVRAQSKENMESGAKAFGSAAAQTATGNPLGGVRSLMNNVATAIANPGLNDEVAGELTKRLMSKDPRDVAAAVKLIEDYSASAEKAFKEKSRNELMTVSGITAAAPPPTEGGE